MKGCDTMNKKDMKEIRIRDGIVYKDKRYWKFFGFKDYRINKDGEIIYLKIYIDDYGKTYIEELSEVKPYEKHDKLYVTLNNSDHLLEKVVCEAFYGSIDLPIMHKYDDLTCESDNVYYFLPFECIEYDSEEDKYYINGVEFRKCPLLKKDHFKTFYISNNGVMYDPINKKIVRHYHTEASYQSTGNNFIHQNVYGAWIGDLVPGMTIDHKDADVTNNDYRNLEQVTRSENNSRAYQKGMKQVSYPNEVIHHVCKMMEDGKTKADICDYLKIPITDSKARLRISDLIFALKNHECRVDIASQYDFSKFDNSMHRFTVVPKSQYPEIMEYYFTHGENSSATARHFGYKIPTLKTIIQNHRDEYRDLYKAS